MNNTITIKIKGYNKKHIKIIIEKITSNLLLQKKKEAFLKNLYFWYKPILNIEKITKKSQFFLPKKIKKVSMNRSPFIFKRSGETFMKKEIIAFINFNMRSNFSVKTKLIEILFKKLNKELAISNIAMSLKVKRTVMVK